MSTYKQQQKNTTATSPIGSVQIKCIPYLSRYAQSPCNITCHHKGTIMNGFLISDTPMVGPQEGNLNLYSPFFPLDRPPAQNLHPMHSGENPANMRGSVPPGCAPGLEGLEIETARFKYSLTCNVYRIKIFVWLDFREGDCCSVRHWGRTFYVYVWK